MKAEKQYVWFLVFAISKSVLNVNFVLMAV